MSVVHVDIHTTPLLLRLRNSEKRLAYVPVNAINNTAKRIQTAQRDYVLSTMTVRKREFILRQAAVIKPFASVGKGIPYAEIAVGQRDRLLLGDFEAGALRRGTVGKNAAVPITGGPARPTFSTLVSSRFHIRQLRLRPVRVKVGGPRRKRDREAAADKVQYKGRLRTFQEVTKNEPQGAIFQRHGPTRSDIRIVYSFRTGRLHPILGWKARAEDIADRHFSDELERLTIEAIARDRGRSFS